MAHILPHTFRLLVRWMYSQKLELEVRYRRNSAGMIFYSGKQGYCNANWFHYQTRIVVRLWVLAQEILIPQLQNQVMDYLLTLREYAPWSLSRQAAYVYENTCSPCPLRHLLILVATFRVTSRENKEFAKLNKAGYPQEFIIDLLLACHRQVRSSLLRQSVDRKNFMVRV